MMQLDENQHWEGIGEHLIAAKDVLVQQHDGERLGEDGESLEGWTLYDISL
jgi:hypothetical protein